VQICSATLTDDRAPHPVRSYFCVTTNLSKGEPAAHCRGKLWRLVRASMTIVGLVPPVFYQVSGMSTSHRSRINA